MSVLADRYASAEMKAIWSRRERIILERKFWIAVMQSQQKAGLDISSAAIADYQRVVGNVDIEGIDNRELITHHDVKARIDEFNHLAGHRNIHWGMTSRDLTENIELIQIRDSLQIVKAKVELLLHCLADRAEESADLPIVARTHNVPAQLTTLGKRFATWCEELYFSYQHLCEFLERLPFRGIKGATGTAVDLLELMGTDSQIVELDISSKWDFDNVLIATGQIYPRSIDQELISLLTQISAAPSNLAINVRLMSGLGLVAEQFMAGQIGSSAMPHKINPRLCERINALSVILKGLQGMANQVAGEQWNEGDVSCSAVRRVTLPDSFFALDAILDTAAAVSRGMSINRGAIAAEVQLWLPEMLSSVILNKSVRNGKDREEAYLAVKEKLALFRSAGKDQEFSTFASLVASDTRLGLTPDSIMAMSESPLNFCGSASGQAKAVVRLVKNSVTPIDSQKLSSDETLR